ncbi:hypothetical protein GJAV_G00235980 [Gymnothorax javanicus]|nr:hypothetical protein GJAV_G00235980 [Gymnothorax javanicus]
MRVLVFLLLAGAASAKTFRRCDLAKTLKDAGMDGYQGVSLGLWVCLAEGESSYRTWVTNYNARDGSTDYGIFQINSRWWCDDGGRTANGCNIKCSSLLTDDISDSITCAKRVVRDPNGVTAWDAYENYCEDKDVSDFIKDCKL